MTNKASDVVIVGGGVIGLSLAYQLATQNVRVTLLEKGQIGQEASTAGAGILAPQAEMEEMTPLAQLCIQSRDLYAAFVQGIVDRTGMEIEFAKTGLLYIALTHQAERELRERHDWQKIQGWPIQELGRQQALRLESLLNADLVSALFFPEEAYVDNVQLVEALRTVCIRLQVQLVTGCEATSLTTEGSRATGVKSNQGIWPAHRIVIAAGCWSDLIETNLTYRVPVRPARGQMVAVQAPAPILQHIVYSPDGYLVPRKDGRVLLGSTVEWVGYDKNVTLEGIQRITSAALAIAPSLKHFSVLKCWAGLRPFAEDGLPVLGATDQEGLYFATGHFRNGLLLAPITAQLMS